MNNWFNFIKKRWQLFTQIALWLSTILASFLVDIPRINYKDEPAEHKVIFFLLAAIIGLLWFPLRKRTKHKDAKFWFRWSLALFACVVVSLAIYFVTIDNWTIKYYDTRLVVGDSLVYESQLKKEIKEKELGRRIVDRHYPEYMPDQNHLLWDSSVLKSRRWSLVIVHMSTIIIGALFLIILLHAHYCYEEGNRASP